MARSNKTLAQTSAPARAPSASARASTGEAAGNLLSLHRAVSLLSCVADSTQGLRLTEAAAATGLSASTAHRILGALVQHRLLRVDEATRRYLPGAQLFRLGASATRHYSVAGLARPSLQRLAAATQDTVSLSVIDGMEALCLDRIVGSYPIKTMTLEVGERRPLGVGAGSLALLAALPAAERATIIQNDEARRQAAFAMFTADNLMRWADDAARKGYAYSPERVLPGMSAVGVAISGPDGRPVASISLSGIASRVKGERLRELVELLHQECRLVAQAAGAPPAQS